jgi:hypothetical protein
MPDGGPHGQVATSRVTEHRRAVETEVIARGNRAEVVDGVTDVEIGAGPTTAGLADTAVLDVPGRDAVSLSSSPMPARYLGACGNQHPPWTRTTTG